MISDRAMGSGGMIPQRNIELEVRLILTKKLSKTWISDFNVRNLIPCKGKTNFPTFAFPWNNLRSQWYHPIRNIPEPPL